MLRLVPVRERIEVLVVAGTAACMRSRGRTEDERDDDCGGPAAHAVSVDTRRFRRVLRAGLAAAALLVVAYLGIALRDTVLTERGEHIARLTTATPAEIGAARRDLERARFLNPDTRPLIAEGELLIAHGDVRSGVAWLERAVRREPENALDWGLLASATARSDPERSRQATAEARRLSPPVAPR